MPRLSATLGLSPVRLMSRPWPCAVSLVLACCLATPAVAATYTVTSSSDNGTGQAGTLSAAINAANQGSGDTIVIDNSVAAIAITGTLPSISSSVTISTSGNVVLNGGALAVSGAGTITLAPASSLVAADGANGANFSSYYPGYTTAPGSAVVAGNSQLVINHGAITGGTGGRGGDSTGAWAYGSGGATGGVGGAAITGNGVTVVNQASGAISGGNGGAGGRGSNGTVAAGWGGTGGSGEAAISGTNLTVTNGGAIFGGTGGGGGTGGTSSGSSGGGGTGGAGGAGIAATGMTLTNTGTITGGVGGLGGVGTGVRGGTGGDGGAGITGSGMTITNNGTIAGGTAGAGGTGPTAGTAGAGGVGIVATGNATIINGGSISGNASRDAIDFSGGGNTLVLQAGSVITGNVVSTSGATNGGDTLTLGGRGAAIFDVSQLSGTGQYQGFSALTKIDGSTWTLLGTSSFAGPVSVNGGTLVVSGDLSSASGVTVNAGGMLAGTGTIGSTTVANGGILAPGSGVAGTPLTVAGNLALAPGAIYQIQVNPSTASLVNATGTAALGGATVNALYAPGSYVARQYTILSAAGGVSGTFGTLANTNLPSSFKTDLSYDTTHAYLNISLDFVAPAGSGLNGNQRSVGNTLAGYFNRNGGIGIVYGGLTAAGLSQASGQPTTGGQQTTATAIGQFLGMLTDPFAAQRQASNGLGAPLGYAGDDQTSSSAARGRPTDAFAMFTKAPAPNAASPWSVWIQGFGGTQTTDANAASGANGVSSRIAGTAVGANYILSPSTVVGFSLAGGGTTFSVDQLGYGRSDLFQAAVYLRHTAGPAYLAAAAAYGWQDVSTDRIVTIAGADRLHAEFDTNTYAARLEGGYRFAVPLGVGLTPYAAAQSTTFDLPAYSEQALSGSNAFALAYAAKTYTDVRSELGLRADTAFAQPDGTILLQGRLAWAHDFDPNRTALATFQSLPGASFVVNGAAAARDSALVTAGIERTWLTHWSAGATFEGEFSDVTRSYAGKGTLRYQW